MPLYVATLPMCIPMYGRRAARDSSCMVHWGTFALSDEPLDEPPKLLEAAVRDAALAPDAFTVPRHGQSLRFDNTQDRCPR